MNNQDAKNALVSRYVRLTNVIENLKAEINLIRDVASDDNYLLEHSNVSLSSLQKILVLLEIAIDLLNKSAKEGGEQ